MERVLLPLAVRVKIVVYIPRAKRFLAGKSVFTQPRLGNTHPFYTEERNLLRYLKSDIMQKHALQATYRDFVISHSIYVFFLLFVICAECASTWLVISISSLLKT